MLGTRGVPARYGGFETAVEEIGERLVKRQHEVIVYCRGGGDAPHHKGIERVPLPYLKSAHLETLSHTLLSAWHCSRQQVDVALVFNAANAPMIPILKRAGIPVGLHMDGLEWKRAKWGRSGKGYYRWAERRGVSWADALIADAQGIRDYYRLIHDASAVYIPYGAPLVPDANAEHLYSLNLENRRFHLAVARMEPENHVDLIIDGYRRSASRYPLVVVGSVPYPTPYATFVSQSAKADDRIRLVGSMWDQDVLNSLYAGALTYLHGHSVGGTNPSLLRAMGAGAHICAFDVNFNREVLSDTGQFFTTANQLAELLTGAEASAHPSAHSTALGRAARARVSETYRWDEVTEAYEALCYRLALHGRDGDPEVENVGTSDHSGRAEVRDVSQSRAGTGGA